MNRIFEIGAFALAGVVAIAGTGAAVFSFMDDGEAPAAAEPAGRDAAAPAGAEFRDRRYGFRFRHPAEWRPGPDLGKRFVAVIQRDATVMCMVGVEERSIASDASGKPRNLAGLLRASQASEFQGARMPNARISSFDKASLGGQEARTFTIDAKPPAGPSMTVESFVTLRGFGVIILMCMAPSDLIRSGEIRDSFRLVRNSFRFD